MLKRHKGSFVVSSLKLDDPKFQTTEFGQKIEEENHADADADADDADVENDAVDSSEDTGISGLSSLTSIIIILSLAIYWIADNSD